MKDVLDDPDDCDDRMTVSFEDDGPYGIFFITYTAQSNDVNMKK